MIIGYARVSTSDQNLGLQLEALQKYGCEKIYQEKVSSKKVHREQLDRLLDQLREGDTVVVWKLDRLGRSVKQLIGLMDTWLKEGINFHSISDGLTINDSAMSKLFYTMIAAFAQLERDMISERTKAGLENARRNGRVGGRRPGLTDAAKKKARALYKLHLSETMSQTAIQELLQIKSTSTYYKYRSWAAKEHQTNVQKALPTKTKNET